MPTFILQYQSRHWPFQVCNYNLAIWGLFVTEFSISPSTAFTPLYSYQIRVNSSLISTITKVTASHFHEDFSSFTLSVSEESGKPSHAKYVYLDSLDHYPSNITKNRNPHGLRTLVPTSLVTSALFFSIPRISGVLGGLKLLLLNYQEGNSHLYTKWNQLRRCLLWMRYCKWKTSPSLHISRSGNPRAIINCTAKRFFRTWWGE